MRQKRAKAYKKQLAILKRSFGFREPFQTLMTSDFLLACTTLPPLATLQSVLSSRDVKLLISQCSMTALYATRNQQAIAVAKQMERRRCGHVDECKSEEECLASCLGPRNKHHYVVATQDPDVRRRVREVRGTPVVYVNRSVAILEPLAPASVIAVRAQEEQKMGVSPEEASVLGKRKRSRGHETYQSVVKDEDEEEDQKEEEEEGVVVKEEKRKRRKGVSGPNPLSVKRPKSILKNDKPQQSDITPVMGVLKTEDRKQGKGQSKRKRKHGKRKTDLEKLVALPDPS